VKCQELEKVLQDTRQRKESYERSTRGRLYRQAKEAVVRADVNARIDRKRRKRDFRGLWIVRLSAACRQRGIRYSQFIDGCKKANIGLNRKMLSEIAIADPQGFDAIVTEVRGQKTDERAATVRER
jgi:large subunit ribosomal protein L20